MLYIIQIFLFSLFQISESNESCLITRYNFYSNFGQVFYDSSGKNLNATNGKVSNPDANDTYPTDRGAYFNLSSIINADTKVLYEFSFFMWVKLLGGPGTIYSRVSNQKSLNFEYNHTAFEINVRVSSFVILKRGISLFISKWIFLGVNLKPNELFLCINHEDCDKKSPISYSETVSSISKFGSYSLQPSFVGFLFKFELYECLLDLANFNGGYSTQCLIASTCTNCDVSYQKKISDDEIQTLCLPESNAYEQDSLGNNCDPNTYGCYKNISFDCKCKHKSCTFQNSGAICTCGVGRIGTYQDCSCSSDQTFNGTLCVSSISNCLDIFLRNL